MWLKGTDFSCEDGDFNFGIVICLGSGRELRCLADLVSGIIIQKTADRSQRSDDLSIESEPYVNKQS